MVTLENSSTEKADWDLMRAAHLGPVNQTAAQTQNTVSSSKDRYFLG